MALFMLTLVILFLSGQYLYDCEPISDDPEVKTTIIQVH